MTKEKKDKGFTLIEIVVVLAVVAALAAFLTPMILGYISDAKLSRAESDVRTIATAMNKLFKDTSVYPGDATSAADVKYLSTDPSSDPTGVSGTVESLEDHLMNNDNNEYPTSGRFKWKGPYLQKLDLDPWSQSYLVNIKDYKKGATLSSATGWVLSAGPDQTLDTTGDNPTAVSGDDIGFRIK